MRSEQRFLLLLFLFIQINLIGQSDVLIENFKVGGLQRYGLSYNDLKAAHPKLIYCSISGFGQDGPLAAEPGYDFLAQAMAGLSVYFAT